MRHTEIVTQHSGLIDDMHSEMKEFEALKDESEMLYGFSKIYMFAILGAGGFLSIMLSLATTQLIPSEWGLPARGLVGLIVTGISFLALYQGFSLARKAIEQSARIKVFALGAYTLRKTNIDWLNNFRKQATERV